MNENQVDTHSSIGDDNGGTLLRWCGCTTVAREEHQYHCYCSVVRGCWNGNNKGA